VFVWYYFASHLLKEIVTPMPSGVLTTLIWTAHYGGIGLSALVGWRMQKRFQDRTKFLVFWMILGTLVSLLSVFVDKTNGIVVLLLALFLGISLCI
jgi:tryptophan-rich sensory protein